MQWCRWIMEFFKKIIRGYWHKENAKQYVKNATAFIDRSIWWPYFFAIFTNLPTIMSSRSADCGLMRVQMSMVNRVLLLLKMEAKEDMRAANITASIRPRKPAVERSQEGRWVEGRGQEEETSPLNWTAQSLLCVFTIWHDGHHQFGISDVGATHLGPTHPLTHLRDNTANLICRWRMQSFYTVHLTASI